MLIFTCCGPQRCITSRLRGRYGFAVLYIMKYIFFRKSNTYMYIYMYTLYVINLYSKLETKIKMKHARKYAPRGIFNMLLIAWYVFMYVSRLFAIKRYFNHSIF